MLNALWIILKEYLPLSCATACGLGIYRLIREPESRVHVLNIADRVSILDLRAPHPINTSPRTRVDLLLETQKFSAGYYSGEKKVVNKYDSLRSLTFDDRKQKDVVLTSALSRSTKWRPCSSVRPMYLPVVIWHSRKGCPQHVWLPLQLRNARSIMGLFFFFTVLFTLIGLIYPNSTYTTCRISNLQRERAWAETPPVS